MTDGKDLRGTCQITICVLITVDQEKVGKWVIKPNGMERMNKEKSSLLQNTRTEGYLMNLFDQMASRQTAENISPLPNIITFWNSLSQNALMDT